MDMYEIATTAVIFTLFILVAWLARERNRLKMRVFRLETELLRKG